MEKNNKVENTNSIEGNKGCLIIIAFWVIIFVILILIKFVFKWF